METVVEDPELVDTFESDGRGRIRLGKRFADSEVSVVVEDSKPLEED